MDKIGFSDSGHTADGKYVVASFRADANLAWVVDLRTFLGTPELKYAVYSLSENRYRVAARASLHRALFEGLSAAEITVIQFQYYSWQAYFKRRARGAEPGIDFTGADILHEAAHTMLRSSPLGIRADSGYGYGSSSEYDPLSLDADTKELPDTDMSDIYMRSGGKMKDAIVLSARAHSMLSPSEFNELRYLALHPFAGRGLVSNMERLKSIGHVFDKEHDKSVPILNELVSVFAEVSGIPHQVASTLALKTPVREGSSLASDHIQAADFAAGWAVELLTTSDSDYRALASKVRWLTVNGLVWPPGP